MFKYGIWKTIKPKIMSDWKSGNYVDPIIYLGGALYLFVFALIGLGDSGYRIFHSGSTTSTSTPPLVFQQANGNASSTVNLTANVNQLAKYTWSNADSWKDTIKSVKGASYNNHGLFSADLVYEAHGVLLPSQLCLDLSSDVTITKMIGDGITLDNCIKTPSKVQKVYIYFSSSPHQLTSTVLE
jgi:hypothetical protein